MNANPATNEQRPLQVHVVSHTHWDREWYHAATTFRQRLVALVDALLDGRVDANRPFLLDGQAIVIEDYLAMRPERALGVASLLRDGSLEAGPWYVLADGLIPSGEAIVRNLQTGRAVLNALGATAPNVAYCPDTFGHAAALPMIARGFGLHVGIVWRGLGGARAAQSDVFRWHGATDDELLLYHLAPDGYEFGSALPSDEQGARDRWIAIRVVLAPRATSGVALLPNGADHHALQPDADEAIAMLTRVAGNDHVVRSSLSEFAAALTEATRDEDVPRVTGELRDSYGYTWTLQGTFATRAAQKRNNARVERLLLRDVEPWLALAWLHGASSSREISRDGTVTFAQAPRLLQHAWRAVLRSHPHDTLCGCSIDEVALAMDANLRAARSQACALQKSALDMALDHDVVRARGVSVGESSQLVVRNRAAYARSGVAEVRLIETLGDVRVGPSSKDYAPLTADVSGRRLRVADTLVQFGHSRVEHERRESPQRYPDDDLVRSHLAVAWVDDVPPLGLRVLDVDWTNSTTDSTTDTTGSNARVSTLNASAWHSLPPRIVPVVCDSHGNGVVLDNGTLRIVASSTGVVIENNGRIVHDALRLETTSDLGDAYTPSLRGSTTQLELVAVRAGATGPLRASVDIDWKAPSPSTDSGSRTAGNIRVTTSLILDASSNHVRVDVRGENRRRNHRLRIVFATDVANAMPYADAAFGPVQRKPLDVPQHDQQRECVPTTMPLHRWAAATNDNRTAAVISDGLAECEVASNGAIAVTLLRAIGQLSRHNLPERPGHAGWPAPIPLAQSLGAFRAKFGFAILGAWNSATICEIEQIADAVLLPLVGNSYRDLAPDHDTVIRGVELSGAGLCLSAASVAQNIDGIVLRCVNVLDHTVHGTWSLPLASNSAHEFEYAHARLDETVVSEWMPVTPTIAFDARPRATATLLVRRSLH